MRPSKRTGRRVYLALFWGALVVRLTVAWSLADLPLVRTPKLDSFEYLDWGQRIAAGDMRWPVPPPHGPGYPFFIGAVLAVFGGSRVALVVAQAILGASSVLLTTVITSRFLPRAVAITAGALQAIYAPLVLLEVLLFAEGLLVFLMLVTLALCRDGNISQQRAFWTGTTLGLASLVRPTALVLLPVLGAAILWRRPRQWRTSAVLVTGLFLALLPFMLRDWSKGNAPLLQGHAGLNFYIGNSPATSHGLPEHRLGAGWDRLEGEALRNGIERPAEQDRYYFNKTLAEIEQRPLAYARLLISKAWWVIQADEVRDSHSFYFFREQSLLLRLLPTWTLLFPLAVCGVMVRRLNAPFLIYGYVIAVSLVMVMLVVGYRYRIPLAPPLCMFAAAGVWGIADAIRSRVVWRLSAFAVAVVAAVLISNARGHEASHNFAEEWAFTGLSLNTERNLPAAKAAYDKALALDQQSSFAWDGLGMVLQNQANRDAAQHAYRRALELNPESARAHYHLGLTLEASGDIESALEAYRKASELRPDDLNAASGVARLALKTNRQSEAQTALTRILRIAPDSPQAVEAARLLGQSR